ncbi:MAG TPA: hypothetical protein VNZ50_04505 [Hyphomicrobiaceae bacterium]|nr:hypothetical protein [Hyphomicrobiaceae bacterium]
MPLRSILGGRSLSAGMCAACTGLLLTPTPTAAQSLLEAWVFVHHGALIPLDQLKESADGTLVPPVHSGSAREGSEVWSVIDKRNCIVRVENTSSGAATEFYLNNMSATRPTVLKPDGSFQVGLMGEKPVHCQLRQSEKLCDHFTTVASIDTGGYRAIERALNHIYAKFCRYEAPSPRIPGSRSDLPNGDRVITSTIR